MKRLRSKGGFTLIELLIVIIIIGILAAIAIPMFLNQRTKAKNAGVKENTHSIQIAIQSAAVDNNDQYAATADVEVDIAKDLDPWPTNPFTGDDVVNQDEEGDFNYVSVATDDYTLNGVLSDGLFWVRGAPAVVPPA